MDLKKYKENIVWNFKSELKYINQHARILQMIPTNIVITETKTTFTLYSSISYENLTSELIRQRYSQDEEFAILRKAISGNTSDYETYNAYVDNCKAEAKKFIAERDVIINE